MKKLITLVAIFSLGFGFYAKAQYIGAQDLPSEISQDFSAKYPKFTKVDWEKDGKHYKATFNVEQYAHQLVYDKNGNLVSQEFGLPVSSLPADVTNGIKKNFPELEIQGADEIVKKGRVSYELSLKDGNSIAEKVLVASNGLIIKTMVDQQ